ncbi:unnamed protein product [Adineta steineri]|uniref:Uncharacterized protein n=1 Tax=Adineta steineri TaxID=433720 RepID=A0A816FQ16_9BILA|nr:unnamed protein product [Adineta steineri]CAF1664614.1 unnamed protein product [Adineta steineri]
MQAMNTDPQPYYTAPRGSHPAPNSYYQPNGIDTHYTPRNPNEFGQTHRMHQPYYPQGPNAYNQPPVYMQNFVPPPQSMSPFPRIIRPPNDVSTGAPNFVPPASYLSHGNNNLQQQSTAYPTQYYRPTYHVPLNISEQILAAQLSNQPRPSINQQYKTSFYSSQSQGI